MGRQSRSKSSRTATPATARAEAIPTAEKAVVTPRLATLLIVAAIAASLLIVYLQVRAHEFVNYDDDLYVTTNQHVLAGLTSSGIRWAFSSTHANWHPLTWLSHMADVELFGLNPGAHALVNVVIHILTSVLVFLLFQRTTGLTGRSAILAILFAVHPLRVESVAWISERKDVLSSFFMLLTLHAWTSFTQKRTAIRYMSAVVAFGLGLMSKGMLVTLPFVLLLFDYWPLCRYDLTDRRGIARVIKEKIPFFVLLVPSIAVTYLAQKEGGSIATNLPLADRLVTAINAYGAYVAKTLWPSNLAIPYPRNPVEPWQIAISLMLLIVASAGAILLARTRRYLFTGWFWFVGMLVPVIGVIQIGWQSMADRYTYLPHIGLIAAIVWGIAEVLTPAGRRVGAAAAIIIAVFLGAAAHQQAGYWSSSIRLFSHATAVTRANSVAHMNLAAALTESGDPAGGLREMKSAAVADPHSSDVLVKLARLEMQAGESPSALAHLQTAAAIERDPETLALLAVANNDIESALVHYQEAVRGDPESAILRNDYAATLARSSRDEEAVAQYREAIRLNPSQYDARMNFGALLSRQEKNDEARTQFEAASRLRPRSPEPLVYLALLNANTGRIDLAIQNVQSAISVNAADANLQFTNAVRMPFKETNLNDYLAFLRSRHR